MHSIGINDQWRICFVWMDAGPEEVKIVQGNRAVTADTALRLGKYFGTPAEFWLHLQTHYDLDPAEDRVAEQIAAITPLKVA